MSLRDIRKRWTPNWLTTDARRRRRNVLFRRLGIARCHTPPLLTRHPELYVRSWLPYVVAHELLANRELTFMQIGAYDGVGDDDLGGLIKQHRLRGVLVEPQPAAFARLQKTYASQRQIVLLQAAIAEEQGLREFYGRQSRPTMAASFDREHLLRHGIPEDDIVTMCVECQTVESALRAAGLKSLDILQVDAEGYDWPILRSIDFTRVRPRIVRFEYRNMPPRDADACLERLAAHGYQFLLEPRDIIAHLAAADESLRRSLVA